MAWFLLFSVVLFDKKVDISIKIKDFSSTSLVFQIPSQTILKPYNIDLKVSNFLTQKLKHRFKVLIACKENKFSITMFEHHCHYFNGYLNIDHCLLWTLAFIRAFSTSVIHGFHWLDIEVHLILLATFLELLSF